MCVFTFFTCQENPDAVFSLASGDSFFTCQEPAANVLHLQTTSDVCFYILHLPREPRCCFFLSFFRTTPDVYKHIQMNGGLTTNTKTYCFTLNLNTVCVVSPIYTTQWWLVHSRAPSSSNNSCAVSCLLNNSTIQFPLCPAPPRSYSLSFVLLGLVAFENVFCSLLIQTSQRKVRDF